jgi:hypothetical protein
MTAAIFGLVGVIVGAAMQALASWLMERRREEWAARKAGRLLTREFQRCRFILDFAREHESTWGVVAKEIHAALRSWPEHSAVLAGTIDRDDDWLAVSRAVDHLQRIEQLGLEAPGALISDHDREFLTYVSDDALWEASFTASLIGVAGVRARPRALMRRAWNRIRRPRLEEQARSLVQYSYEVEGKTPPEDSDATPPADPTDGI